MKAVQLCTGDISQLVESFFRMSKALGSIPTSHQIHVVLDTYTSGDRNIEVRGSVLPGNP